MSPYFNQPPVFGPRISDDEIFCEGSRYTDRGRIKQRLIASGLPSVCALCGNTGEWQGRPLTLQLDHINGVPDDNRRENLRLLCPNCHSQTETFTGRRTTWVRCTGCDAWQRSAVRRCRHCRTWTTEALSALRGPLGHAPKIAWPPSEELVEAVRCSSYAAVGRSLGVSDNAVRKHLRKSAAACR
jgi:hypothetical protein